MIVTRGDGTPIARPDPSDYPNTIDFLRAFSAFKDEIADVANKAFDKEFRAALRRTSGGSK